MGEHVASRGQFLKMAAATGLAGALASLAGSCSENDEGAEGGPVREGLATRAAKSDFEIVNYWLTLEHVEADFYDEVNESGLVKNRRLVELVKVMGDNEAEHVRALVDIAKASGATPAEKPRTDFAAILAGGERRVLEAAADLETLAVAAYLGQLRRIGRAPILSAGLSIHAVEGRHAAVLNHLVGRPITPDGAFARPASMAYVRARLTPFLPA